MNTKYLYLHTMGCQMNVYDSEQIAMRLATLGYEQTSSINAADLIVVNTCTVRAKAQQKAFSLLGRIGRLKSRNKKLIVGVGGCVAQQEGQTILERVPCVDLVFGTQAIERLPILIQQIESKRCRIVDVQMPESTSIPAISRDGLDFTAIGGKRQGREVPQSLRVEPGAKHPVWKTQSPHIPESIIVPFAESQITNFVTIMRGCDNYCSYCVVPYVRGRETSRKPDNIIREIRALVADGAREVTLLGQNVNSYGKKEGLGTFPELLSKINDIEGLCRIRFTTSHPKDLSAGLIQKFKDLDKLCQHIHLPVQSGSNKILRRMNRKYTTEQYLDKVAKLRDTCPEIAITSDVIVGFPGETGADFEQTLDLIRTVEYDGLFAFVYSDRPNVPAVQLPEKLSEAEKSNRLQTLLVVQKKYTKMKNMALVGSNQLILTDGLSKKQISGSPGQGRQSLQWTGRTSTNKIVNFSQDEKSTNTESLMGKLVDVQIEKALAHSLIGKAINVEPSSGGLKGASYYAA